MLGIDIQGKFGGRQLAHFVLCLCYYVSERFYNIQSGEFVEKQLFFVNIVESISKITSTVFIAVGRFYELGKMKEEEIGENYVQK